MAVYKPSWLQWWLDNFNFYIWIPPFDVDVAIWTVAHRGDWLTINLSVGDWIETAIDATMQAVTAAIDALAATIPNIYDVFSAIWEIWDYVYTLADNVSSLFSMAWNYADSLFNELRGDLLSTIFTITDFVTSSVATALNTAKTYAAGLVYDLTLTIWDWIDDRIDDVIGDLRQSINTVLAFTDDINDLFSDPLEWLYKKTVAMIEWFW